MARQQKGEAPLGVAVDTMEHRGFKRFDIPLAGDAQAETVPMGEQAWPYVPHDDKGTPLPTFDPHYDPQLLWARKSEMASLKVPTYSLHQHEALNPIRLLRAVLRDADAEKIPEQLELFGMSERTLRRLRTDEMTAYHHLRDWTNRLIAGDSLLVMNSLLTREGFGGKVQCIYMDPPYGIKFRSNFMPRMGKLDVREGKDEDLSSEPEMIRAFRDTWELGLHSYLTYLRDRLTLVRELLAESGSLFLQISMENVHRVRLLLDELFGAENCVSMISYATTSGNESATLDRAGDYILWYAKDITKVKYHELYKEKVLGGDGSSAYSRLELPDGTRTTIAAWERETGKRLTPAELKACRGKVYCLDNLTSQGKASVEQPFEFQGKVYTPGNASHWKPNYPEGLNRLVAANRVDVGKSSLGYVRYWDDFPYMAITNQWMDTLGQNQMGAEGKIYVVQTALKVIERCLLMTTDPGDLVLDPTCGSGTTAVVAEKWGRRWITMDTSRIALALAKRRLLAQAFDWYQLRDEAAGVDGGLVYETVPHVTLGSIANGEAPSVETLWDKPKVVKGKVRVTGPFTVEAVPAPEVLPLEVGAEEDAMAQAGDKRTAWLAQLKASGIVSQTGERIRFASLEVTEGLRYFCAEGETLEGQRALVCLGSESAPMTAAIVNHAVDEAEERCRGYGLLVFAAFQFDDAASKDIAQLKVHGRTLLKVQMNVDLQMGDLLKRQPGDKSFILIGQPEVEVKPCGAGRFTVAVKGFDYYDPSAGTVTSGKAGDIAMWMLDPDYNGRCVNPRQIFFPKSDAWKALGRALRGTVDPARFEAYVGLESLPFEAKADQRIAVKIIDVRGNESLWAGYPQAKPDTIL